MGFVESTLAGGLLSLNLDRETEAKALLAFNKVLWIQNDYFAKYYCSPDHVHDVNLKSSTGPSLVQTLTNPSAILPLVIGAIAGAFGAYYQFKRS